MQVERPWGEDQFPPKAGYSARVCVRAADRLLSYAEMIIEMRARPVQDKITQFGIDEMLKQARFLDDRMDSMNSGDVNAYCRAVSAAVQDVLNAPPPVFPDIVINCKFTKVNRSGWARGKGVKRKTDGLVDALHYNPRRKIVRLRTDGDNLHRRNLVLNGDDAVELLEIGRRGTLFDAKLVEHPSRFNS